MPDINPVIAAHPGAVHLFGQCYAMIAEWKGRKHLDIREWFPNSDAGGTTTWLATKRGIQVDARDLDAFAAAMPGLIERARKELA